MDTVKSNILAHCDKHNCAFIDADFVFGGSRILLEPDEFLRSIEAERPRAVYWSEEFFDIDEFIETELLALGWKPGFEVATDSIWLGPNQVKSALADHLQEIENCVGTAHYLVVLFPCQGVLCATSYRAPWAADLGNKIDALILARKHDVTESVKLSESEDAEILESLVLELVVNDAFKKTKGLNKRLLLATKLFGDRVPRHPNGRVTRIAQNGDLCDLNLVMVVKEADEKIWLESNLPDK